MPEPALAAHPPNDHLNRRLLRRSSLGTGNPLTALLEQLCTDSVYRLKDDFDSGLNANLWTVRNLAWDSLDPHGSIVSESDEDDPVGQGIMLHSRLAGWKPNFRPVMMTRLDFQGTSNPRHFEVGMVSHVPANGAVTGITSAATSRVIGVDSFGVAVRDSTFANTSAFYVASGGPAQSATAGVASQVVTPNISLLGSMTLMVALNEQGETRLWVNGTHDNAFADGTMRINGGHHLWLYSANGAFSIDFIQAWQERQRLV